LIAAIAKKTSKSVEERMKPKVKSFAIRAEQTITLDSSLKMTEISFKDYKCVFR